MYLVDKIIKKCENSSTDWRRGQTGRRTIKIQQEDYDRCGKTEFLRQVGELEEAGLVIVEKWLIRGSDVERIAFRVESLPQFYAWARDREGQEIWPKQERVDYYRELLERELQSGVEKPWICSYYEYLLARISEGDFPKETEKLELYLTCLRGIDGLTDPIYKRVFSKQFLKNSKQFEKEAEKHIISIARKYCGEIDEGMDDKTVLNQLLIEEYAQELELKGPLLLALYDQGKEESIDLSAFKYGTVLNSATLKNSRILPEQPSIKRVVTIENKANFVSADYRPDTLYLFSHGYFSPKEKEFLRQLRKILGNEAVEYYHSGDLDYGGVKIYEYIKQHIFPELRPLQMDVETFNRYLEYGEPLEKTVLKKLPELQTVDLTGIVERMIETGMGIEQESFLIEQKGTGHF